METNTRHNSTHIQIIIQISTLKFFFLISYEKYNYYYQLSVFNSITELPNDTQQLMEKAVRKHTPHILNLKLVRQSY
jgi:hypothetical protein